jgi:hypothetical protein
MRACSGVSAAAATGGESFVFRLLEAGKFRFVNNEAIRGQGVGSAGTVPGDDAGDRAVMERYDMSVFGRFNVRLFKSGSLWRFVPDIIMQIAFETG